ncbi:hypothetical protein [Thomasclavelia cocleata]|uniref:hypothetical protein n=1 Tax=Thomasclavelia cocleata TaxID=69824 RepID=UPI00242AB8B6|nr:hypothetical protein [Thomasclavelia cocleata]
MVKSKVSQTITSLQENMGYTRNEAIKLACMNTNDRFQKNILPALAYLQENMRYKAGDLDNLYAPGTGSRWYQGVMKKDASRNIKILTVIKLATAFEISPGELIDFIINFDKKKK